MSTRNIKMEPGIPPKEKKKIPAKKKKAVLEVTENKIDPSDSLLNEEEEDDEYTDDLVFDITEGQLTLENDDFEDADSLPEVGTSALAPFMDTKPERVRDSLYTYLREISRFPMLKPEEELELARRVKSTGDTDAAYRLISSHLRLAVRIAMDFQRRWMQNVLDLVQEGNVGLVKAVSKFDPEKGIKFSYYATFWIKAYILKFIMDNWRLVKIGTTQTQRKLFYNLNRERQRLISLGYDPDTKLLAEHLNVTEDQIIEMEQRLDASDMSLDAPINTEEGAKTRLETVPALGAGIEEVLGNKQVAALVRDRLQTLTPLLSDKEQYILEHRLLSDEPITLREIGDHFGITRERVRQIEVRLLQKVRDHLVSHIKDFSQDWIEQ